MKPEHFRVRGIRLAPGTGADERTGAVGAAAAPPARPGPAAAILAAILLAALLVSPPALAQPALIAPETTGALAGSIALSPAQETELRLHAAREGARPVAVKERVAVGAALPAGVELQAIPQTVVADLPAARGYRYVATDAGLAIVNPETRRVVRLIEGP